MKKLYLSLLAAAAVLSGCSKFLDVNPKGEVFDADMFNSSEGYEDALYGIYNELATSSDLYAGSIGWIAEMCSGNFVNVAEYKYGYMSLGDWVSSGPESVRKGLWQSAYETINHLNNIIGHAMEAGEDQFRHSRLYKGEALALRALVHFELVRVFGVPVWAGDAEKAQAIPYVKEYTFDITPFSSWQEVYHNIIDDLKEAERLLAEDESLVPEVRTNSASGFTDARITHLNLYAVQALLARVYWSMDDMDNAAVYAMKVIDSGKFSFRPQSAFVQPDNGTLDLNETIFGLYSKEFQTANRVKFQLGVTSSNPFNLAEDWKSLYEGASLAGNDYRLSAWFNEGDNSFVKLVNRVFYEGSSDYGGNSIIGANILRIPEMYFILAEYFKDSNPSLAAEYFDAVITTRGRDAISKTGQRLTDELLFQERRREFYGEGFTWHEMKKKGLSFTDAAGNYHDGSLVGTYTVPIPVEEYDARDAISVQN